MSSLMISREIIAPPDINNVKAFGKLWLENKTKNISLPSLHFLVTLSDDGFDAICLDLCIHGYGKSVRESIFDLIKGISFELEHLGAEEIINTFDQDYLAGHWGIMRKLNARVYIENKSAAVMVRISELGQLIKEYQSLIEELGIVVTQNTEINLVPPEKKAA